MIELKTSCRARRKLIQAYSSIKIQLNTYIILSYMIFFLISYYQLLKEFPILKALSNPRFIGSLSNTSKGHYGSELKGSIHTIKQIGLFTLN